VPTHYTSADAQRFTRALAAQLGLSDAHMLSAYEDVWYYLWRERRLPVNVDPFDSKLGDEMERMRLRRVFEQKLDSVVGYVLPVKATEDPASSGPAWRTGPWFLRDERMYLMPGDSPMGLRLPLDSLPWVSQADFPYLIEQDPSTPRADLPGHGNLQARYSTATATATAKAGAGPMAESTRKFQTSSAAPGQSAAPAPSAAQAEPADFARVPQAGESAHWVTRTAL
jgi:uncharacterized protein (DUF2126 family)